MMIMRRDIVVAGCLLGVLLVGGCAGGAEQPSSGGAPTPAPTPTATPPSPPETPSAAPESTTPAPKPKPTPPSTEIPDDEIAMLWPSLRHEILACPEDAVREAYDLCWEEMDLRLESVDLVDDGLALVPARPAYRKLHQRIEHFRDRYRPLTVKRCFSRNPAASHATCHKYADRIRSAHAAIRKEVKRLADN